MAGCRWRASFDIGYVFLAVLLSTAISSSMIAPVMSAVVEMR